MFYVSVLLIFAYSFAVIVIFPSTPSVRADQDEDQFVHHHGNDVNRSGVWPQVRKVAHNEEKLKEISFQAHKFISPSKFEVVMAKVVYKVLTFSDSQYKPILADMIEYKVLHEPETRYHLSKGLRSDCVFHLWLVAWDEQEEFELNGQVCSIYDLSRICP